MKVETGNLKSVIRMFREASYILMSLFRVSSFQFQVGTERNEPKNI
ncbi:Uncharacterized protein dnm_089890 [Desulfonema magnum]|uniref:Uncharacterized protein n=1 Tax=Desulfonema magnum TaxID=45655 RepID=A0A975BW81_9BACT|nr:Uncharacterized protein dnm_089890 [Desulfonema magnum]